MKPKRNKSLVFMSPDYHCSFIYRDELRKLGWKADIYLPPGYPELLVFDEPDYRGDPPIKSNLLSTIKGTLKLQGLYFLLILRYKYHFYYGNLEYFSFFERRFKLRLLFGKSFRLNLAIARILGVKIIYLPSGAPDEEMPAVIAALGNSEEGLSVRDKEEMRVHFRVLNRYADLVVGYGVLDSSQYEATHLKYKSIDLERWQPDIDIPSEFKLDPTENVRILHSFMFGTERIKYQGGNIKGTKYLLEAVDRLKDEGYKVELLSFDKVASKDYRYLQVQADIVVEELIRGSWGSTAVECLALGKPVVTFVRPEWEKFYYELFPETFPLPFINANKWTIYSQLKKLLDDTSQLQEIGRKSRKFAEEHLNPRLNVPSFINAIEKI